MYKKCFCIYDYHKERDRQTHSLSTKKTENVRPQLYCIYWWSYWCSMRIFTFSLFAITIGHNYCVFLGGINCAFLWSFTHFWEVSAYKHTSVRWPRNYCQLHTAQSPWWLGQLVGRWREWTFYSQSWQECLSFETVSLITFTLKCYFMVSSRNCCSDLRFSCVICIFPDKVRKRTQNWKHQCQHFNYIQ